MVGSGIYVLKKIAVFVVLFVLVSISSISASLDKIKIDILSSVAHGLFGKSDIKIYLADSSFLEKIPDKNYNGLIFTDNCSASQLIIADSLKNLSKKCLKKSIFATNYPLYKSKYAIGALFWQKGRPVLILKKKALMKKHIKVGSNLAKYLQ